MDGVSSRGNPVAICFECMLAADPPPDAEQVDAFGNYFNVTRWLRRPGADELPEVFFQHRRPSMLQVRRLMLPVAHEDVG